MISKSGSQVAILLTSFGRMALTDSAILITYKMYFFTFKFILHILILVMIGIFPTSQRALLYSALFSHKFQIHIKINIAYIPTNKYSTIITWTDEIPSPFLF